MAAVAPPSDSDGRAAPSCGAIRQEGPDSHVSGASYDIWSERSTVRPPGVRGRPSPRLGPTRRGPSTGYGLPRSSAKGLAPLAAFAPSTGAWDAVFVVAAALDSGYAWARAQFAPRPAWWRGDFGSLPAERCRRLPAAPPASVPALGRLGIRLLRGGRLRWGGPRSLRRQLGGGLLFLTGGAQDAVVAPGGAALGLLPAFVGELRAAAGATPAVASPVRPPRGPPSVRGLSERRGL